MTAEFGAVLTTRKSASVDLGRQPGHQGVDLAQRQGAHQLSSGGRDALEAAMEVETGIAGDVAGEFVHDTG